MSRALIAIGVSKSGSLQHLPGAVTDAEQMAAWAKQQEYEFVAEFTDKGDAVVSFGEIYDWIADVLERGDLERLIICFSGHGYAPMNGHEVWLLSNWEDNGNEAINASGSITYAQAYGSPQISFIADACRTTWSTNAPPYGQVLLPKPGSRAVASQVDQFYATKFGFVAQEAGGGVKSFGIFNAEFRKALNGDAHAWIDRNGHRVVTSRSLEDYLDIAVPEVSGELAGFVQQPDTLPQWKQPKDIYVDLGPAVPFRKRGGAAPSPQQVAPPKYVRAALSRTQRAIDEDKQRFIESEGRKSFETGTGATVVGAKVLRTVGMENSDLFQENGAWHVRARTSLPITMLLELEHEAWKNHNVAAISIYPELIATAVVDKTGVSSLNYAPSLSASRGMQQSECSRLAADVLAEATAFLRHGHLLSRDRLRSIVEVLRHDKYDNPALAIVASSICYRMGDWETVEDILRYDIGRGPYTPFDLAVLGGKHNPSRQLVGTFPLLSSTWGALATSDFEPDERLVQIVKDKDLTPSLWTMVTLAGAQRLEEMMRYEAYVGATV